MCQRQRRDCRGIGKRFVNVLNNLGLYDQDYLVPTLVSDSDRINPQRELFLDEWLPKMITDPDGPLNRRG